MIREFIYKYYIDPIRYGQPYTLVDTLTYALILLVCIWLIYRWLEANHISIDREFVYSLIPWVVFGGCLRVVEDTGYITSDLHVIFTTPLIFFLIFALAMPVLFIANICEKRGMVQSWKKLFQWTGIALTLVTLGFLTWFGLTNAHIDTLVGLAILTMATVTTGLLYTLIRYGFGWHYM